MPVIAVVDDETGRAPARGQRRRQTQYSQRRGYLAHVRAKKWTDDDILERGVHGKAKWFNVRDGYGFVARSDAHDDDCDLFVHRSSIVNPNKLHMIASLADDEVVQFDIAKAEKGLEAVNVTAIDGGDLIGNEVAPLKGNSTVPNWAIHLIKAVDQPRRRYGEKKVRRETGVETDADTDVEGEEKRPDRPAIGWVNKWDEGNVVDRGVVGTVKWFALERGYGFVARDDANGAPDMFVHRTSILAPNPMHIIESLAGNERIAFDVLKTDKGHEAIHVTAVGGGCVAGKEYAPAVGVGFVPEWAFNLLRTDGRRGGRLLPRHVFRRQQLGTTGKSRRPDRLAEEGRDNVANGERRKTRKQRLRHSNKGAERTSEGRVLSDEHKQKRGDDGPEGEQASISIKLTKREYKEIKQAEDKSSESERTALVNIKEKNAGKERRMSSDVKASPSRKPVGTRAAEEEVAAEVTKSADEKKAALGSISTQEAIVAPMKPVKECKEMREEPTKINVTEKDSKEGKVAMERVSRDGEEGCLSPSKSSGAVDVFNLEAKMKKLSIEQALMVLANPEASNQESRKIVNSSEGNDSLGSTTDGSGKALRHKHRNRRSNAGRKQKHREALARSESESSTPSATLSRSSVLVTQGDEGVTGRKIGAAYMKLVKGGGGNDVTCYQMAKKDEEKAAVSDDHPCAL